MLPRLGPVQPFYAELKAALATYHVLADRGGWPGVPDGPVLKPGMQSPRIVALRRRLLVTGELQQQGEQPQVFDQALSTAVKSFQTRHYLEPDGIVGKTMIAALNVPVEERINQMRVNLERARWVFHDVPGTFVVVDIAGFSLQYRYQGALAWSTRVVVGQPFNQTPIFRSEIRSMVLNPTWTVPAGIVNKEMVPNMLRNPRYLKEQNLRILDGNGREIPAAAINMKQYANKPFPHTIRQDAGVDGALGRIKFLFQNPYSVYLHDTPSKALFGKTSRAFSHGCIRVQNPLELGKLLLRNDPGNPVNATAFDRILAKGNTESISLKTPVPVILMYWTTQVKDGKIWFKPDLYQRDFKVLQALNAPPHNLRIRPGTAIAR
jgi:L,D-transpeptidase YcbB